jgi:SseB protein N-terminal domain/SseB protein C-terminal domain
MTMPTSPGPKAGVRLDAEQRVPRARGGGPDADQPATGAAADTTATGRSAANERRSATYEHGATYGKGPASDDAVTAALAAAIRDGDRIPDLLDVLSNGRLWVPLPDDGRPVTDGSSLTLPTVTYLGSEFVPAFTSADGLVSFMADPGPDVPPPVVPHVVVPAAELARSLPPDLGIALNPGAEASVPVYPAGVAYLAAVQGQADGVPIRVGLPPQQPTRLITEASAQLRSVPAVRAARSAWLSVSGRGEGLIFSIDLDNPSDQAAQDAAAQAVERAAALATEDASFPIDVTFPGEAEPNPVAETVAASAAPFYWRA